jgi:hypothetical protein
VVAKLSWLENRLLQPSCSNLEEKAFPQNNEKENIFESAYGISETNNWEGKIILRQVVVSVEWITLNEKSLWLVIVEATKHTIAFSLWFSALDFNQEQNRSRSSSYLAILKLIIRRFVPLFRCKGIIFFFCQAMV